MFHKTYENLKSQREKEKTASVLLQNQVLSFNLQFPLLHTFCKGNSKLLFFFYNTSLKAHIHKRKKSHRVDCGLGTIYAASED